VEGVLAAGEESVPLLLPALEDSSPNVAFAAAYPLLRLEQSDAVQRVWEAFAKAEGGNLKGLCQALSACCPPALVPRLIEAASAAPSLGSVAALEILAFNSPASIQESWLNAALAAEPPPVRAGTWRVVSLAGVKLPQPV